MVLVPADQLEERRAEHPELTVLPLKFGSGELRAEHWRFLMGAVGNQSTYIRQFQRIMKANRRDLRLDVIRPGVEESGMPDHLKQLAQQRLDLAEEYIDDSVSIKDIIRPGRMIIMDLRDEFIEKDEALGLFVVLMQLFAEAQGNGGRFNKLVVFDEAHKYIESPDLVDGLVSSVREMRHKGMSVLVASQDPPSVPIKLIELSDVVVLHKFNSPAWLRHMQKAAVSLADLITGEDGESCARRSLRVVQQVDRGRIHPGCGAAAAASAHYQARWRHEDCGQSSVSCRIRCKVYCRLPDSGASPTARLAGHEHDRAAVVGGELT